MKITEIVLRRLDDAEAAHQTALDRLHAADVDAGDEEWADICSKNDETRGAVVALRDLAREIGALR